jgi:hypothetical protein
MYRPSELRRRIDQLLADQAERELTRRIDNGDWQWPERPAGVDYRSERERYVAGETDIEPRDAGARALAIAELFCAVVIGVLLAVAYCVWTGAINP